MSLWASLHEMHKEHGLHSVSIFVLHNSNRNLKIIFFGLSVYYCSDFSIKGFHYWLKGI